MEESERGKDDEQESGGNVSVDGIWIRNESGISTRKW